MGYYGFSFEIYNITLILSSYSLPIAVSKLVATRGVNKEYKNSYRVFMSAMLFAVCVGLVATLILFFGADFFSTVINNDKNAALPLRVLAPTIFVFSIMGVLRGFYQGKHTMLPTAVSQVLEQIVNAIVSIVAAYFLMKNFDANINVAAYGAAGGTLGTFVGAFIGLLFLLFVYAIYRPVMQRQLRKDTTLNRESYHDIFKLLVITIGPIILSQTVYQISGVIDNSLFGHIMATKEVTGFDKAVLENVTTGQLYLEEHRRVLIGIYSNKYRNLSNVPVAIASAIGAAIVTSITAAMVKGNNSEIRSKVHSAIKFDMIIAIPSAVGMGVLASPILQLIYGDSRQLSANFLRLGSIAIVFYSLSTVSSAVLQGINKLRLPVINSAISLGFHILLVFILLKFTPLSTYSLVIGNVVFALVVSILNWISIEKHLGYRQEIVKTFVIPFVSAGLMGVAAYLTYQGLYLLTDSNALATLIAVFVAIIVYFALLVFMKGVEEEELHSIPKGDTITRILKKLHLL
jgi:stage V sporulation protein B